MDEDRVIHKAEFLAEFFCSPLAVEVYNDIDLESKVEGLNEFASALWDVVKSAMDEEEDTDTESGW